MSFNNPFAEYSQKFYEETKTTTVKNPDGTVSETKDSVIKAVSRENQPDFIILYTTVWCECNDIPSRYRELFLQLAFHMSFVNSDDIDRSQLVDVSGPHKLDILEALNWKEQALRKGLKALCDCNAIIRRTDFGKSWYQINPSYAARGAWSVKNGIGIKDFKIHFDMLSRSLQTVITVADDEE